jgi:hypothetical protein
MDAGMQFPVVLLTGPRQVGKTSMLEHLRGDERTYVTLDDMNARMLARTDPELFLQQYKAPVLIDEVQYAPELFAAIKQVADAQDETGLFWLTGSQSFPLMQGITESLAGRVAIMNLLGFSAREADRRSLSCSPFCPGDEGMAKRGKTAAQTNLADVYARIWRGSFPALVTGRVHDRDLFYQSYVQTYLQRDVRDLLQVGDLDRFMWFLKAVAARTAQLLNYTDLARDCGISVNTARSWVSVLQASHQVVLLPAWHSNLSKRLYTTPKMHLLDTGLCAYLTEWSSPQTLASGAMAGAILETYVVSEILKSWWHRGREPTLYHYRDKDRREIDVLISRDGRLHPVAVKRAAGIRANDVSAFDVLERLSEAQLGKGAVVSLSDTFMPLTRSVDIIPVGWI